MTESRPSILLIGVFPDGRPGRKAVCEELSERLHDRGWVVSKASSKQTRAGRLIDLVRAAWIYGKRCDIAQVEVFSGSAFVWAEAVCGILRVTKCPYVLTLHGGNLPEFARRWPRRVSSLLASADAVTVPSPYLWDHMTPYRQDIILLPNALELDDYCFRLRNLPQPRLVWLRSFHGIYNPQLAINMLLHLRDRFQDIHLTMIGPDKGDGSFQATKTQVERYSLSGHVTFPGPVAKHEVPTRLDQADIFVNLTSIDNTPLSVLEAMASGLCVVSTNVGGIPYLLTHEHNALLVPAGEPRAFADAVSRVLLDSQLASNLSRNARQTVESFGWSSVLPRWLDLFSSLRRNTHNRALANSALQ